MASAPYRQSVILVPAVPNQLEYTGNTNGTNHQTALSSIY